MSLHLILPGAVRRLPSVLQCREAANPLVPVFEFQLIVSRSMDLLALHSFGEHR